jgi:peptidoglycan/xylan/chitin deacetylase (PgdA/CDA1 family)/CelD/BcsL family acetyltransferase involved in cellulose biosynthesis
VTHEPAVLATSSDPLATTPASTLDGTCAETTGRDHVNELVRAPETPHRAVAPTGDLTVAEIRDQAGWERLALAWNPLLERSASATTFLTWEWVTGWWSVYGNSPDLRILTALDDGGVLRGIAPLRYQPVHRFGQTFPSLAFLGDGSNDSDYLDFIVERGFEGPVMAAWLRHLREDLGRGLVLRLNDIPATSPNLGALRQLNEPYLWDEQTVPCPTVRLPTDWNEYLAMLRPRFRTKIRSVLRNLEARNEVRFGFCEQPSELDRLLPALFELHTRRWNDEGRPGVFGSEAKRRFYGELSTRLLDRGALRLSWLEWNGRLLACQYGFLHDKTYLHLQEGYEPASDHWNIGVGLRAWSIRELIGSGVAEYDFLAGTGRHKTDWGAEIKESRRVLVAARTPKNLLLLRGPQWQEQATEVAKRILPERVLAIRRGRMNPPMAQREARAESAGYIRRTAAKCYFHLGGPTATEFLRARYQPSLASNGTLFGSSWQKRRKPTGRILYYHRVNDERDPFFPSLPIDVFERQMRHVARRHKVVSLGGLVDHLASGSPETVVAITFDDGYRDNYEGAFPILQRYGLPATIFLATGSVDSGEPLWFEVLSAALKATTSEFLDLEIDLPRRLWLRTREERLRANDALFTTLRGMSENERQQWLNVILRRLPAPDVDSRRNKMLTWEQVRTMKRHQIDFGGHTVTHPYLSRLSREEVTWEISECKRRIESEQQSSVEHFAYPNGREEDFTPWNKEALRDAGYKAAVTTIWGMNDGSTDRLELRRGQPWEEDEALCAYKMDFYQLVNG